jgi:hypothetical protein
MAASHSRIPALDKFPGDAYRRGVIVSAAAG